MTKCCVCLEIVNPNNTYKCNLCINTFICCKCYISMKSRNIHNKCPVCRRPEWCNAETMIINVNVIDAIEMNNFDHENNSYCNIIRNIYNNVNNSYIVNIVIYILLLWLFIILTLLIIYK